MKFSDILNKYGSVSCDIGTDKNISHSYGFVYDDIFNSYNNNNNNNNNKDIAVLEIGFACGASLIALSEYFKDGKIYGIDICPPSINIINPNILTYIGDATLNTTVNYFNTKFDIIIEDASHLPEHQIQHFKDFNKFLKPNGIYIIEDVNEKYLDYIMSSTLIIANNCFLEQRVFDLRHIKNRFDDILLIFYKK
jgi:fibrillarin-like rRNA methylase